MIPGRQVGQGGGRFRHAVALAELAPEDFYGSSQRLLGDRRAAVGDEPQAVVPPLRHVGHVHQTGLDHGRHQRRQRDPFLAQHPDDLSRVEVGHDVERRAPVQATEDGEGGRRVVHRRDDQPSLTRLTPEVETELHDVRRDRAVRQDGTLRAAGGAARVHLIHVVRVADVARGRRGRTGVPPALEAVPGPRASGAHGHETVDGRELPANAVDDGTVLAGREDQLCLRIVDDVDELRRGEPVVQRHRDGAGLGRGQVREGVLDAVLREDRHPVTLGDTAPDKGRGLTVDQVERLAVREPAPVLDGELHRGMLASVKIEEVVQAHGHPPPRGDGSAQRARALRTHQGPFMNSGRSIPFPRIANFSLLL